MYSEKPISEFIASLNGQTAEEKLNDKRTKNNSNKKMNCVKGEASQDMIYKYTDKDIIKRVMDAPEHKLLDEMNELVNNITLQYKEDGLVCPNCGAPIRAIGNNGNYCKECGQHINNPEVRTSINIGQNLKDMRISKGLTIKDVTSALNISNSKLSNIENNKIEPKVKEVVKMAELCNCSIDNLLNLDNSMKCGEACDIKAIKDDNGWDWGNTGEGYIFVCPSCGRRLDPTPIEALSVSLSCYEHTIENTEGNDGNYCKSCGVKINRPFKTSMKRARRNFDIYIEEARKQVTKRRIIKNLPIKKTV